MGAVVFDVTYLDGASLRIDALNSHARPYITGTVAVPRTISGRAVIQISNNAFSEETRVYWSGRYEFRGGELLRYLGNAPTFSTTTIAGRDITTIAPFAFQGFLGTTITLPDTITRIGRRAFENSSVQTINFLGDSLYEIGDGAFFGTSYLDAIVTQNIRYRFPNLTAHNYIAQDMFRNSGIRRLDIPPNIQRIDENAFADTSRLITVNFIDSQYSQLNEIGYRAFSRSSINNITLPHNVTVIGGAVFMNSYLAELNITSNYFTHIGAFALAYTRLTAITLPASIQGIVATAFNGSSLRYLTVLAKAHAPQYVPWITAHGHSGGFPGFSSVALRRIYVPNCSVAVYRDVWYNNADIITPIYSEALTPTATMQRVFSNVGTVPILRWSPSASFSLPASASVLFDRDIFIRMSGSLDGFSFSYASFINFSHSANLFAYSEPIIIGNSQFIMSASYRTSSTHNIHNSHIGTIRGISPLSSWYAFVEIYICMGDFFVGYVHAWTTPVGGQVGFTLPTDSTASDFIDRELLVNITGDYSFDGTIRFTGNNATRIYTPWQIIGHNMALQVRIYHASSWVTVFISTPNTTWATNVHIWLLPQEYVPLPPLPLPPPQLNIIDGVLISYTGNSTDLTIPDTVTSIAPNAFTNNTTLQRLTIPHSVSYVGANAFSGVNPHLGISWYLNPTLTTQNGRDNFGSFVRYVILPQNTTYMNYRVFLGLNNLVSVSLPSTIGNVTAGTFDRLHQLEYIFVANACENSRWFSKNGVLYFRYTSGAFAGRVRLEHIPRRVAGDIVIPEGVERFSLPGMLTARPNISSVTIPYSMVYIGRHNFVTFTANQTIYMAGRSYAPASWNNDWNGGNGKVVWLG